MNNTQTRPVSPLTVAKNRYDEATRVTDAYKIQLAVRTRKAEQLRGTAPWAWAWARVQEAEDQLAAAEQMEVRAGADVAWEERRDRVTRTRKASRGR